MAIRQRIVYIVTYPAIDFLLHAEIALFGLNNQLPGLDSHRRSEFRQQKRPQGLVAPFGGHILNCSLFNGSEKLEEIKVFTSKRKDCCRDILDFYHTYDIITV